MVKLNIDSTHFISERKHTMKNKGLSVLSFLMIMVLLLGTFASCKTTEQESDTKAENSTETKNQTATEDVDTSETQGEDETETEPAKIKLTGEHAELIELANGLKNGVVPYYSDSKRQNVTIDNQVMSMGYRITNLNDDMMVTNLSTPDGKNYIENTMDVFVELTDGNRFYASRSVAQASLNIYRYGYYYYENRIEGQTFANEISVVKAYDIDVKNVSGTCDIAGYRMQDGALTCRIKSAAGDPWVSYRFDAVPADDYDYIELTLRTDENSGTASQIFIIAGSQTTYTANQYIDFGLKEDGKFHTYLIPLKNFEDYTGTLRGIRLDINGSGGSDFYVKSLRLIKAAASDIPSSLSMQRSFLTYSDKLHQIIQLSTKDTVNNVANVGIITNIKEETVDKLLVKDKNGLKETLDGVDWASVEYVGFDIKDAGIFGYILPCDNESGSIEVTLKNGIYTVIQEKAPKDGKLIPSTKGTLNGNDFYMGNRIYNDETHDFETFIYEAECERHPLTDKNITVEEKDGAKFGGYDPLFGYYKFTVSGTGFNQAYYLHQNKQYHISFTITGDDKNRQMYLCSHTSSGGLESAALLDSRDMLLPIPIEVAKNFAGDGENTIYNIDDTSYGETFLPMVVNAGETVSYTLLNLYQNWGIFPLKQISSIQFHVPYYHLSTGVTETNCIVPLVQGGPALPDHRAMSAPLWPTQPQHTSAGAHSFFIYSDYDGNTKVSENTSVSIDSYGPTYCDITLGYQSSDGKIEATYTHTEMPQLDENRAYYEMTFTFREDVSFRNFSKDFYFYKVTDNNATGTYKQVGYLDENNQSQIVKSVQDSSTATYILGDNCPYFSFFDMPDYSSNNSNAFGYVNIGCLIYNYKVTHEGEELDTALILHNTKDYVRLSLDLRKIEFKAGDTITLNMILMPWGSEELNYTGSEPDKNVRIARENTLLNPLKLTAGENCRVIESVFVPKAETTNGKSAEFTISGGNDNSTVRIYGFNKLTAPKIEEYVDGKWVEYVVYSYSQPDSVGFGYYHDGYMVHYDGNGTFSYSFVITMDNGASRKFRITAEEDFKGWPEIEVKPDDTKEPDPINVYVDPEEFFDSMFGSGFVSKVELSEDKSYVRFYANPAVPEAYATPYKSDFEAYQGLTSTGQYIVLKYRVPANQEKLGLFEFFTSTIHDSPVEGNNFRYFSIVQDGEWQVLIIDASKQKPASFTAEDDGSYFANFLRLDFFDKTTSQDTYIDIAYIGFCDSLEKLYELNKDMDSVTLVEGGSTKIIDPKTGK